MLFDLHEPFLHICKGFFASDVVAEEDAISAAIKDARDAPERLLARCVPDLELYNLVVDFDYERAELNTNSNLVL